LYYFGSLWRPREEKGVSLRGVRLPAAAGEKRAGELGAEDLAELEKEVEGKMGGESVGEVAGEPNAPVRTLAAEAAPVAADEREEDRHFVAEADDFYPTDERMHRKK